MHNKQKIISKSIYKLIALINTLDEEQKSFIEKLATDIIETFKKENCVFWCGNGGSAAESQHLAAELIGRFKKERIPYKSISLTSDSAVLSCISNDYGYQEVFSRQIAGLGNKGDILIALSTSGKSVNIERVIKKAKEKDIKTFALLGKNGGIVKDLADYSLVIHSNETARIQELHLLIGHIICEIVEEELND